MENKYLKDRLIEAARNASLSNVAVIDIDDLNAIIFMMQEKERKEKDNG